MFSLTHAILFMDHWSTNRSKDKDMVKQIVKDTMFLSRKSVKAIPEDLPIAQDLEDTLRANHDLCVGMAANMIGHNKRIIIVATGFANIVMINPVIREKSEPYHAEEGCLSLSGTRKTTRYNKITVDYQDKKFEEHTQTFIGQIAQIIQHECDHLEGILI